MSLTLTLVIAAGLLAVLYGIVQTASLLRASPGNARMQEIAAAIQEGAQAYLRRQYTAIAIVGFIILLAVGFLIGPLAAVGFLIGSVLSFYWRDEVVPYYGGGMDLAREVAGNDFMYWNLMQAAAARGCRLFDFGRSKLGTGAYDFKKNWGFVATPLPYEYKLYATDTLPDNNPLNPKYQLFIKVWKKLPLPVANFLGPYIVRNLG